MPRHHDELDRALAFLGPIFALQLRHVPASAVLESAAAQGIHPLTLWRAARRIGIRRIRSGFGPGSRSVWVYCRRCPPRPPPQFPP